MMPLVKAQTTPPSQTTETTETTMNLVTVLSSLRSLRHLGQVASQVPTQAIQATGEEAQVLSIGRIKTTRTSITHKATTTSMEGISLGLEETCRPSMAPWGKVTIMDPCRADTSRITACMATSHEEVITMIRDLKGIKATDTTGWETICHIIKAVTTRKTAWAATISCLKAMAISTGLAVGTTIMRKQTWFSLSRATRKGSSRTRGNRFRDSLFRVSQCRTPR